MIKQIVATNETLYALLDDGSIYAVTDESPHAWQLLAIPGLPELPSKKVRVTLHPAPMVDQHPSAPQDEPMEITTDRPLDVDALPPKLRALVSDDTPVNMCPRCGMPWNGSTCIECEL